MVMVMVMSFGAATAHDVYLSAAVDRSLAALFLCRVLEGVADCLIR